MRSVSGLAIATALASIFADGALGQALHDSAGVPQPHLAKARAYAAQEKSWRHPGLGSCYWDDGQPIANMNRDLSGRKVFDNLYYVGNGKYGVYAIDTRDGIILIDSMNNQEEVDKYILPNMKSVGLDPARLKILILSHGHGDHFGGAAYLQQKYGVRTYMSAADWDDSLRQNLRPEQGRPPKRDLTVNDGDVIALGEQKITVYISPGIRPDRCR